MHSIDLERAALDLRETERAIGVEQEHARASSSRGRDAMLVGDPLGRAAARTQEELAEWRQQRLHEVRLERQMLEEAARRRYTVSRVQSEQMKYVLDRTETQMEIEAERKAQTALDDRFLARRRWTEAREELLDSVEISPS